MVDNDYSDKSILMFHLQRLKFN